MAAVHMRIGIETIYQDDGAGTPFLAVKSRIGTIEAVSSAPEGS